MGGARPVAGGLGSPEHRVRPHLLCGPQQPDDAVHRPPAAHHYKVTCLTHTTVLVWIAVGLFSASDKLKGHVKTSWFPASVLGMKIGFGLQATFFKGLFLISVSDREAFQTSLVPDWANLVRNSASSAKSDNKEKESSCCLVSV